MRVVGNLWVPTGRSRDFLLQAKGITGIESTQVRRFTRWSGRGGWSGSAELSGGRETQTKGQGTVRWATTEAARRGGQRANKELLSRQFTRRNRAWSSSDWKHSWAKGSPSKKAKIEKKERRLLHAPILKLQKGVMSGVMRSVMNENQKSQSQFHVTALWCLRVKPGKRGLNSQLWPVLQGAGLVLTHYLITWLEMDGQHDTRDGSSCRDPAHC